MRCRSSIQPHAYWQARRRSHLPSDDAAIASGDMAGLAGRAQDDESDPYGSRWARQICCCSFLVLARLALLLLLQLLLFQMHAASIMMDLLQRISSLQRRGWLLRLLLGLRNRCAFAGTRWGLLVLAGAGRRRVGELAVHAGCVWRAVSCFTCLDGQSLLSRLTDFLRLSLVRGASAAACLPAWRAPMDLA